MASDRTLATFARRWPGRVLAAVVLLAIPAVMLFRSLNGGTYADDSWTALLMTGALALAYLVSRRLIPTVLVGALVVGLTAWTLSPSLADSRIGDAAVLGSLDREAGQGMLAGFQDLAVARVDLDSAHPVRFGGLGADETTLMEVGSLTKAMTGLVIRDAVDRGELRMDIPVSTYLPQLAGSPAGTVTLNELVTHTAGYAEFGAASLRRALWGAPLGQNFLGTGLTQLLQEAREGTLPTRGAYAYSTLGAAIAGQAAAAAAGMSYPDLMRTRLFEPLAMTHTVIEDQRSLVPGGRSKSGLRVQPWLLDAYAPGGGAVSTTGDLARLATALLDGTAPGLAALDPTTATDMTGTRIGDFWHVSTRDDGRTLAWHNGQTGGYSSYFGVDRTRGMAVIVLSDVANPAAYDLGVELLADHD